MGKLSLGLGLGVGYVLGTRAGRARYEQIQQAAARLTGRPEVQEAVSKVRDTLPASLQGAVDGLVKNAPSGSSAPTSSPATSPATSTGPAVAAATTGEPGLIGGPAVVSIAAEDEAPVAPTFPATEPLAGQPPTERDR